MHVDAGEQDAAHDRARPEKGRVNYQSVIYVLYFHEFCGTTVIKSMQVMRRIEQGEELDTILQDGSEMEEAVAVESAKACEVVDMRMEVPYVHLTQYMDGKMLQRSSY